MLDRIFIGLVMLTPLVILRDGSLREVGRVYWLWGVVEAWCVARIIAGRWKGGKKEGLLAVAAWLGVWGLEAIFGQGNAVWGGWWRRQGWVTMAHVGMLMVLVGTTAGIKEIWQRDVLRWVKATAVLVVAVG